jgi:uncharacterized protein YjbI with pentapeptide repeats
MSFFNWSGWSGAASLIAAAAAVAALWFSGQSLRATQHQYALSEQAEVTDRFAKAVASLGSENVDVRLGGIYSLERLSRDSTVDRPAIMDVLGAYVRGHAPAPLPEKDELDLLSGIGYEAAVHCPALPGIAKVPIDVQAAITVINRRDRAVPDLRRIDLSHSCLNRMNIGVRLHGWNLADSDMTGSDFKDPLENDRPDVRGRISRATLDLSDADLTRANLSNLIAFDANLSRATLRNANLGGILLADADLQNAYISSANLTRSSLSRANLANADFSNSNLSGAHLDYCDLKSANLLGAYLEGAGLSGADLTDALILESDVKNVRYSAATKWPKDFKPPPPA